MTKRDAVYYRTLDIGDKKVVVKRVWDGERARWVAYADEYPGLVTDNRDAETAVLNLAAEIKKVA